MNYQMLSTKPKTFQSVAGGISHKDFTALHKEFASVWHHQMQTYTATGSVRQRKYSVRSDSALKTTQDMLLFVLSYLKNNPTQEYHALQWNMTQSQSHPWLERCQVTLRLALMRCNMLPARTNLELVELLDGRAVGTPHVLRLDGTERPIERPQDSQKQKSQYSGKKKAYDKESHHQR
jgi:hypothetical protein